MTDTKRTPIQRGLTSSEVAASREAHGDNVLTPPERDPWWKLFLEKFEDPVIRILAIAAGLAILIPLFSGHGSYVEGVGIIVAILLATVIAFVNEFKAAKEFDLLNLVNDDIPIKVYRDGQLTTVGRRDIVVGDVILVEIGEEIPADAEVLEAVSLQVDESQLTGESLPVAKHAEASKPSRNTTYPSNVVMRGTTCADGHATLRVTAVGNSTEIGKTQRAAVELSDRETPLNEQLDRLSRLIGVVGFGIAALTFVALVARGWFTETLTLTSAEWFASAVFVIGVMVAAVKVWLPIVYDGFELSGSDRARPGWLESEGLMPWLITMFLGVLVTGAGIGIGISSGTMSSVPGEWLSAEASTAFIGYFMIALTIIVVAVPEGLAMSVTLSLAYSMRKMTAENNLVRKMHACETIGAATAICSDKTGTLTMNQMRVAETQLAGLPGGADTAPPAVIVEAIAANSTAHLGRDEHGDRCGLGNPTEAALLMWLESTGEDYVRSREGFGVGYQWVFSTQRKFMATLGDSPTLGPGTLHVKGAPEIVLSKCRSVAGASGETFDLESSRASIEQSLRNCQARGMRTLGLAYRTGCSPETGLDEVATELVWLGFVAIADPVRPDVPNAIKACREAGIAVKIVTGDNSETAKEIGRQIGLDESAGEHMTGPEFEALSDEEVNERANGISILSRARPMDKLRMVRALQARNNVVAVTGDGTNDAPALNHADVGLAMGKTGTSVAKEASDIILLDDSFRSVVNAVLWGRSLYRNIQRFILFQLTINVVALVIALLGPFIGVALPLTVIQMLWVNLIMDTFAALALAAEPPNWGVMRDKPRGREDFIVTPAMARGIFGVGAVFIAVLIGFLLVIQEGGVDPHELSLFFTTFVMLQFWNMFNARRLGSTQSALSGLGSNLGFLWIAIAIFAGQILITQFGGEIFRTTPLSLKEWLIIAGGTSLVLVIGEFSRFARRLRHSARTSPVLA